MCCLGVNNVCAKGITKPLLLEYIRGNIGKLNYADDGEFTYWVTWVQSDLQMGHDGYIIRFYYRVHDRTKGGVYWTMVKDWIQVYLVGGGG
jgi:hypothetical protein